MTLPATIICGFLGAGKTTLLNHLLHHPGAERLAVLVNDFGAINIDRDLIKVEAKNQIELTNGCVCCSIQDDLAAGLVSVSRLSNAFTRVVLECSGVSHPAGVLGVFDSDPINELFSVDGLFCLVDTANILELDFQSTELAIDQAAASDLVLLNKIDLASELVRLEVRQTLQAAQRSMRLLEVVQARVPVEILFGFEEGPRRSPALVPKGRTDSDDYESASFVWDAPISVEAFRSFCEALPSAIFRGKGVLSLATNDGLRPSRGVFQLVGKRTSVEIESAEGPKSSRLILIARRGELDRGAIDAALQLCPGGRAFLPDVRRVPTKRRMICE